MSDDLPDHLDFDHLSVERLMVDQFDFDPASAGPVVADRFPIESREKLFTTLLADNPDAAIAAAAENGLLVPLPDELAATGWPVLQCRVALELIHRNDWLAMLRAWRECLGTGIGRVSAKLGTGEDGDFHFLDLHERYGVRMIVLVRGERAPERWGDPAPLLSPIRPRHGTTHRDQWATVVAIDEPASAMLGWTLDELRDVDPASLIHTDDQDRALQNWLDVLAQPDVVHRWRGRHRRGDGSWLWIEFTNLNELDAHGYVNSELFDISGEMAAVDALEDRERLLREVAEALPVGVVRFDLGGRALYVNGRAHQLLDLGLVSCVDDLLVPLGGEDRERLADAIAALPAVNEHLELQVRVPPAGGRPARYLDCQIRRLGGRSGDQHDALLTLVDTTEAVRLSQQLARRANTDSLTGALSRSATLHRLASIDNGVAAVFLDLDDFKDINDRHGHDAGDAVLRSVVERLRTALGRGASIGRLGGDEFLVILPGVAGADEAFRLADEVRLASQHQVTYGEAVLPVSGSVGVAWAGPGRIDAADLITRADEAMYRSKRDRRSGPGPSE